MNQWKKKWIHSTNENRRIDYSKHNGFLWILDTLRKIIVEFSNEGSSNQVWKKTRVLKRLGAASCGCYIRYGEWLWSQVLPLMAKSEGSRMWSLQSNQLSKSPLSEMTNTVGDTESTATMCPCELTARPATMSMYLQPPQRLTSHTVWYRENIISYKLYENWSDPS
jgi:hypothetical protein